jgi:hypothetical protein
MDEVWLLFQEKYDQCKAGTLTEDKLKASLKVNIQKHKQLFDFKKTAMLYQVMAFCGNDKLIDVELMCKDVLFGDKKELLDNKMAVLKICPSFEIIKNNYTINELRNYFNTLSEPQELNTIDNAIAFLNYHSLALSLKALESRQYEAVASEVSQLMVTVLNAYVYPSDTNQKGFFETIKKAINENKMENVNKHRGVTGIIAMFIRAIFIIVTFGVAMKEKNIINTATKNRLNLFSLSIDKLSKQQSSNHVIPNLPENI